MKEESFQKQYGIDNDIGKKWTKKLHAQDSTPRRGQESTPRRAFDSDQEGMDDRYKNDAMSDTEATTKNFKRNNLVEMFLRGTEVDDYIANNLYGRGRKLDDNDNIGEMTLLENLNPDETFTD